MGVVTEVPPCYETCARVYSQLRYDGHEELDRASDVDNKEAREEWEYLADRPLSNAEVEVIRTFVLEEYLRSIGR